MKIADIDRFFEDLARRIDQPIQVLLTGGAAGILQGMDRATFDIDFELRLKRVAGKPEAKPDHWDAVQRAIEKTGRATGITPQYGEDIAAWSSIALPAKRSRLYRRFGEIEVRILDPELWAIGKLTRYLSTDVQDLIHVLKAAHLRSKRTVMIWGTALGSSPASSGQTTYRRQVESFLEQYAHEIWGRNEDPEELKRLFLESARETPAGSVRHGADI